MHFKSSLRALMIALVSLAPAQANIVPTMFFAQPDPLGGGLFRYTYFATIDPVQGMNTGDFLTLYDIAGFADAVTVNFVAAPAGGGSVGATGFSVSNQPTGINPPGPPAVTPLLDTPLTNLTITRTGAPVGPDSFAFFFSFNSTVGQTALIPFAAQGTLQPTPLGGAQPRSNDGTVLGPGVAAVPEPSVTVMLGVAGLLGLGCRTIRRRRSAA